jgi:hypothetical protein
MAFGWVVVAGMLFYLEAIFCTNSFRRIWSRYHESSFSKSQLCLLSGYLSLPHAYRPNHLRGDRWSVPSVAPFIFIFLKWFR